MDKETFADYLKNMLTHINGYAVKIKVVTKTKNNGVQSTGLLMENSNGCSPILFIDRYYEDYMNGRALEDIVNSVTSSAELADEVKNDIDLTLIESWEKAKNYLDVRILSLDKNYDMLQNYVYMEHLDFAVIPILSFVSDDSIHTVKISNELVKMWNVSTTDVFSNAIYNSRAKKQYIARYIKDSISEYCKHSSVEIPKMIVLSNIHLMNGAASILDTFFMEEVYEEYGGPFYVLPSSIHECIAIPAYDNVNPDNLRELVKSINDDVVSKEEILSYSVYFFDGEELSIAAKGEWDNV